VNVTILTAGSRGDVQPYVAVGVGLQRAGHRVLVATHPGFRKLVEEHGLRFAPVAQTPPPLASSGSWKRLQGSGDNFLAYLFHLSRVTRRAGALLDAMLDDFWVAVQDADLVVSSTSGFGAPSMAAHLGVPFVWAMFQPMTPTQAFPHFLTPGGLRLGSRLNRGTYVLAERAFLWMFDPVVKRWLDRVLGRGAVALRAPTFFGTDVPVLYGFSRHVVSPPPDWGTHVRVCGFWPLEPAPGWHCSPRLARFLEGSSPPVYFYLTGMRREPRRELLGVVIAALRRTGRRGILSIAEDDADGVALPATVLAAGDVPHEWLFPRVAAVVYHGGAGTTASILGAGVPAVGSPAFWDQPFWSRRIHELGIGPAPLPLRHLTGPRLAEAIDSMLTDPAIRERAAALGVRVRAEDGIRAAVDCLTRLHERSTPEVPC
jgi:sterol 3beta-glucosyltransferase